MVTRDDTGTSQTPSEEPAPATAPGAARADLPADQVGSTPSPPPATAQRTAAAEPPWLTPRRLAALVMVLLASYAALSIVRALRTVLVMITVSLFLSFAMEPAVQWMSRRGMRRSPATALVFLGLLLAVFGFFALMVPMLVNQLTELAGNVPRILDQLDADLLARLPFVGDIANTPEAQRQITALSEGIGAQLRDVLLGAASEVLTVGATAVGVLFQLATIALLTFYLVADGPRARQTLARPLPPARQREMLALWEIAVSKTGGYIYSRVLLAVVAALAHAAFFLIIALPSPIPLAVWIGVTSAFIPVIGTYLGALAAILVALGSEPIDALFVVIFAVVYQQLENYFVAPRIQSSTMDVHPAIAFISVVIGGTLLGAVGALLALPATAIIQALLSTYVRRHEVIAELADTPVHNGNDRRQEPRETETSDDPPPRDAQPPADDKEAVT